MRNAICITRISWRALFVQKIKWRHLPVRVIHSNERTWLGDRRSSRSRYWFFFWHIPVQKTTFFLWLFFDFFSVGIIDAQTHRTTTRRFLVFPTRHTTHDTRIIRIFAAACTMEDTTNLAEKLCRRLGIHK